MLVTSSPTSQPKHAKGHKNAEANRHAFPSRAKRVPGLEGRTPSQLDVRPFRARPPTARRIARSVTDFDVGGLQIPYEQDDGADSVPGGCESGDLGTAAADAAPVPVVPVTAWASEGITSH